MVDQRAQTESVVQVHDPSKACPGYVLFQPMYADDDVLLINLDGAVVHRWAAGAGGMWGYLLPNGNLFHCAKSNPPLGDDLFPTWRLTQGGMMRELDASGTVLWEHHDERQHHDGRRTSVGGAIYLAIERMPDELAATVPGGVAGTDGHGMWADVIVEVDAAGEVVWEWHSMHHLDPLIDHLTFNDGRHEWGHANTVAPIGDDRVMVSFRNISAVVIIDKASGDIVHRVGAPLLAQQHDPSMLDNGNILMFDNGAHRHDISMPFSRVLEIDLSTNLPVWSYQAWPLGDFFSPFIGGARRLPNGNTLITEGTTGRLFQVTATGEIVWEFVNPHSGPRQPQVFRPGAVFRASHYLPEQVAHLAGTPY